MSVQLGKGTDWKPYFTNSHGFCRQFFPRMRGPLPAQIYRCVEILAGLNLVQIRGQSPSGCKDISIANGSAFFHHILFQPHDLPASRHESFPLFYLMPLKISLKRQAKLLAGPLWGRGTQIGALPKSCSCATEASTHLNQHPDAGWKSYSALKKSKIQTNPKQTASSTEEKICPGTRG